jgi:hypothetical protein
MLGLAEEAFVFERVLRIKALMFKSSNVAFRVVRRLRFFGVGILIFSCGQLAANSMFTDYNMGNNYG